MLSRSLEPNYFSLWKSRPDLRHKLSFCTCCQTRSSHCLCFSGLIYVCTVKGKAILHSCVNMPPCWHPTTVFRTSPYSLLTSETTVLIHGEGDKLCKNNKENKALSMQACEAEFRYTVYKSQAVWAQHWRGLERQDHPEMVSSRFSERSSL